MRLSSRLFNSVSLKSSLMGIAIALGVAAFAFTGVGTFSSLDPNTAAKVGGQTVSTRQLQEAMQELERQNSSQDPAQRRINMQTALNQLIQQKVLVEEANRMGWSATDVEVADWIKRVPSFQNKDTKQFDIEVYRKFLKSGQLSELDLYRNGREVIASQKYQALVGLPDVLPAKLIEEREKRGREEFLIEYVEVSPKEDVVKKQAAADATAYAADAKNDEALKKAYEAAKADFSRKAQVRVQSILVGFKTAMRAQGSALTRSEADAQALAEATLTKVKAGEDFAQAAGTLNDDPNAKAARGDIGWIDDTNIDPETAKAAFALTPASPLSGVVKTPYGFRLVKLLESRPAVQKSFEDAKGELALRAVSGTARTQIIASLEKAVGDALKLNDRAKLDAAVAAQGLSWKKVAKPVNVNTRFVEELGLADSLLKTLFTLKAPGDTVPELLDFSGKRTVVRLVSRTQSTAPDASSESGKQASLMARAEGYRSAQAFAQGTSRKLFDVYSRDKEITQNTALFRQE